MKLARLVLVALAALALVVAGCTRRLPTPTTGPHVGAEPVTVPYPPPPPRVEVIPPVPEEMEDQPVVWIDGEWLWRARRWIWQAGRWEAQYPGSYYAPPTTVRLGDGSLSWFQGAWVSPPAPAE